MFDFIRTIKNKAINSEININFHNYLKSHYSSEGKRQWRVWNNTFLTLLLGGCMYALSLSRRSCAVSIRYCEERIRISSTGPATGHDAFLREPVYQAEAERKGGMSEEWRERWLLMHFCYQEVFCEEIDKKQQKFEVCWSFRIQLTVQLEVKPPLEQN